MEEPRLWDHQREGVNRALACDQGFAWLYEPGCGKTLTTITALRHLFTREGRAMKTLIFGPQIVVANWAEEIRRFSKMGDLVCELRGSRQDRIKAIAHPGKRIFITNFEALDMEDLFWKRRGTTKVPLDHGFEVMVFDESHRMKNGSAQRTKTAIKLRDTWKPKKVFLLTGTPILNASLDIWAQWRLLDGGKTFTTSFVLFRARFFENKNATAPSYVTWPDWQPREGSQDEIARAMARSSHHVKKAECLDLPPLIEKRFDVSLSKEQEQDYRTMEKDLVLELRKGLLTAPLAVTKLLRLQQILSGSFLTDAGETHTYKSLPRLDALCDIVEDLDGQKVIVWTPWGATYPVITKELEKLGRKVVQITGQQTAKQKDAAVAEFRFGDADTVVANPAAAGTGVNLTEASVAIWYCRTFSLEHRLQGEARNYRGGSTMHQKVTQIDLVAPGTVDEKILMALSRKQDIGKGVLAWAKQELI